MSAQGTAAKVRQGLSDAIASGTLPGNLLPKAESLLATLNKPVRLTLMGLPGTGKSQLMNLLANADVIPDGVHLPTTQLVYGDTAQSTCTMPDGSTQVLEHCDTAQIAALQPVFVELALPLAALRRISVLEVVASDDQVEQQRAMMWATKRTDVALWCTQAFPVSEQALWGAMPDIVKDHGFMIVTKSDILAKNDLLDSALAQVKAAGEHEFNQILPVATPMALDARQPDGSVDKDMMRRSGGLALISAILRQVELGQQATVDQGAVLLRQSAHVAAATPAKVEAPAEEAEAPATTPDIALVKDSPVEESSSKAAPAPATEKKKSVPLRAISKTTSGDEFPEPIKRKKKGPVERPRLQDGSKAVYTDAIAYLTREGRALVKVVDSAEDKLPVSKIMNRTVDNVQWLADHLQDNGDDGDPLLERAREAAMDAADLIQLMQMEKQDSAIFDAVSLVLQLKHELEADLAA